jgi:hypothetical protein
MSGFFTIDLAVGMIFIYFLLGITYSSAAELWFLFLRTGQGCSSADQAQANNR